VDDARHDFIPFQLATLAINDIQYLSGHSVLA
jgi:hypothetical protein